MTTTSSPPAVAFDKVSFAFDDLVVLRDVSFCIPQGGMTVLLGAMSASVTHVAGLEGPVFDRVSLPDAAAMVMAPV